jgi:hypothetical protein
MAVTHPVDDQVVDDATLLVRQEGVLRLAVADAVEVVREHRLQELVRGGAFDVQLPHVGDIERARVAPDGEVLGNHSLVLHGHLPARKRHHSGAGRHVALVQRRPAEGRVHGRDNSDPASRDR